MVAGVVVLAIVSIILLGLIFFVKVSEITFVMD